MKIGWQFHYVFYFLLSIRLFSLRLTIRTDCRQWKEELKERKESLGFPDCETVRLREWERMRPEIMEK